MVGKRKAKPASFDTIDRKHIEKANYELGQMWESISEQNSRLGHIEGIVEEGFKTGTDIMNNLDTKLETINTKVSNLPCKEHDMRISYTEKKMQKATNVWDKIKWYIFTTLFGAGVGLIITALVMK
jgi:hypothetical protein